jgi:hypothetical protein
LLNITSLDIKQKPNKIVLSGLNLKKEMAEQEHGTKYPDPNVANNDKNLT